MLEGVFVHEAVEVLGQCAGDFCGSTRAGAIHQALDTLICEAMDPLAQGGIGKLECVGNGLKALPFHDLAHGLSTAEDAGFCGLFYEGV